MSNLTDLYNSYLAFVTGEYGLTCFVAFIGIVMFIVGYFCCLIGDIFDSFYRYHIPFLKRRYHSFIKRLRSNTNSSDSSN